MFEAEGYQVTIGSSAEAGLQLAAKQSPDVIVLDVRLPGMDGLEAIEQFHRLMGGVPIVLMTAFGDLSVAVRAYQSRVAEYLTKPFDLERATEAVRSALRFAKARGRGGNQRFRN